MHDWSFACYYGLNVPTVWHFFNPSTVSEIEIVIAVPGKLEPARRSRHRPATPARGIVAAAARPAADRQRRMLMEDTLLLYAPIDDDDE